MRMSRTNFLDFADFRDTPIVQIDLDNYTVLWPSMIKAIKSATFVALDTELSGLGNRKQLISKDVEDRYQAMAKTARTHSILSLGLSCYRLKTTTECDANHRGSCAVQFEVQTFNVLVLCQDAYTVEPESLKFLSDHGFDFNRQCSHGLPYKRGHCKEAIPEYSLRRVYAELMMAGPMVVLHNAMVDIIFLYESFYTALPSTLSVFTTDLSEMFPSGIYDTKYISEFVTRTSRSYLEYLFRRRQRDNSASAARSELYTYLAFPTYEPLLQQHIVMSPCGLTDQPCQRDVGKTVVCAQYDGHGWCKDSVECTKSHDMDLILDAEDWVIGGGTKKELSLSKKVLQIQIDKPVAPFSETTCVNLDSITNVEIGKNELSTLSTPTLDVNRVAGHSAGFDAFMTGYVFASYVTRNTSIVPPRESTTSNIANNLYLCAKDFPLKVGRSSYSKPSKGHRETYRNIQQSLKYCDVVSVKELS